MFLFGLTADQMAASRGWYNPVLHYNNEPETRAALHLHLAALKSYVPAQEWLGDLYADQDAGARKAGLKVVSFQEILERPYNRRKRRKYLGDIAMPSTVTMMPVAIALQGYETEVTR